MQNPILSNSKGFKFSISIIFFVFIFLAGINHANAENFVKKTQEALIEKGFDPGPADGIWGPLTEGAIKNFQERQGFKVSGFLDHQTRKSLFTAKKSPAPEKMASDQRQQKSAPATIPESVDEKVVTAPDVKQQMKEQEAKVSPKQMAKTPEPVSPPKEAPRMTAPPVAKPKSAPEPKKVAQSSPHKSSGPCPQPRKTKSAPSNIAKMDKTSKANLENGEKIYTKTAKPLACKQCHGDKGDGKGKLGAALKPNPRNFICNETMKGISAGQMFWVIKNGSPGTGMVGHKKTLKDNEIWDVVKYVQSAFMGGVSSAEVAPASSPTPKSVVAEVPVPAKPVATSPKPEVTAKPSPTSSASKSVSKLPKGVVGKGKYEETTVSDGGSISGLINFSGKVPLPIMEDLSKGKNVEFCATHPETLEGNIRPRSKVISSAGKLKDTVVFIQNIEKGKAWPTAVNNIDFKTCDIFPKVSVVRKTPKGVKKGLLTITNQDPEILHNPHGYSIAGASRKTLFNKPLPSKGDIADVTGTFKRFKPSKDRHFFLQCDQHNFMEADARVVWNPYYSISGADGAFKIDQIPAGKYWVTAWHPYIGEVSQEVTVSGGADVKTNFELTN